MSPKEQIEQKNTIEAISKDLQVIKRWWPVVAGIGSAICIIAGSAISVYRYTDGFVKKEEYVKMVKLVEALNAKVDRNYIIDSTRSANNAANIKDISDRVRAGSQKVVYGGITEYKDKQGKIHYLPAPNIN